MVTVYFLLVNQMSMKCWIIRQLVLMRISRTQNIACVKRVKVCLLGDEESNKQVLWDKHERN